MSNLEGDMKGFWKLRDLKRIIGKVRDIAEDEGVIDELEDFVNEKVIELVIEEITNDALYKALIRSILTSVEEELEGD